MTSTRPASKPKSPQPTRRRALRPQATGKEARAANVDERFRVRRFDADRTDVALSFDQAIKSRPTSRQLLWIDIGGELKADEGKMLADRFKLDDATRNALEHPGNRALLALHGQYLHVRINAEPNEKRLAETPWLDIVAGGNVVITHHEKPIRFLDDLNERINEDTSIGILDAPAMLGSLLNAAVTSYFRTVDAIEGEVDELDGRSLRDEGGGRLLEDLVTLRRRIARLRRLLTDQRGLFASLAGPDVAQLVGTEAAEALKAVSARFESALSAVEDSRDVLLGSFDVIMTRTGQRTNDVMKILALATVLLLPGSLIAGLLGMNVAVPLPKDDPASFWIVVVGVVLLAVVILSVARYRRWL
jgi:Mg2+ and Co2+ transporter CorA